MGYALIVKGGGAKGLAFVGALKELEPYFDFDHFAGASAGAIVAVLGAAGYTASELETILSVTDFSSFLPERFRTVSNLTFHGGLYTAASLTSWIDCLLAEKADTSFQVTFSGLPNASVYACRRDTDALVFDIVCTQGMSVAYAVRCSASIPLFFTPARIDNMRVFDGGLRHNFPVKKFLDSHPDKPFIGLYLGSPTFRPTSPSLLSDILATFSEGNNIDALRNYPAQTIIIDPDPIGTLDFALSNNEKAFLLAQGSAAALEFLKKRGKIQGQGKIDAARLLAAKLKEIVLKERRERASRKRRKGGMLATAILILLSFFWYFHNPWSFRNCSELEAYAQRRFLEDKSTIALPAKDLIDCRNPAGYALLGAQAFYQKHYNDAGKHYTQAISHVPARERHASERWDLWRDSLASIQIETGEFPAAIAVLNELVAAHVDGDIYKWDLARAYVYRAETDSKYYDDAIDILRTVDPEFSGKTQAGRTQVLLAAALVGKSLASTTNLQSREILQNQAKTQVCFALQLNADFWKSVLAGRAPYPNSSFKEEIRLLKIIYGSEFTCQPAG